MHMFDDRVLPHLIQGKAIVHSWIMLSKPENS